MKAKPPVKYWIRVPADLSAMIAAIAEAAGGSREDVIVEVLQAWADAQQVQA